MTDEFDYPESDLDKPAALLSSLGSFWSTTYDGMDVVQSILVALAALTNQSQDDVNALTASVGRHSVPILHVQRVYSWVIKQSDLGDGYGIPVFDDGNHAFDNGVRFDTPAQTALFAYPLPSNVVNIPVILNRLTATSRTLVLGVDYLIDDGRILFRVDPFADPLFSQQEVFQDNTVVDREVVLWFFRATFDRQSVDQQFGYALGLTLPSTQSSKDLVNTLLDACVDGSTNQHLRKAWSAVTGVPLTRQDGEVVRLVRAEPTRLLIITDRQVYIFDPSSLPLVEVGDTVSRFQPLTDALLFFEFNQGQVPLYEYVKGLGLGRGFLAAGFFADLIFQNKEVPTVVGTDADGFTTITFEVDGFPGDVSMFFDTMQARGRASGYTLAHLLDRRPLAARDSEPDALALPATINPMAFLCQNIFRSNVLLVRIKTSACQGGTGIASAKALRMLVPPQCCCFVLAELTYSDDPITMDGPGDETRPGYLEAVSPFLGNAYAETLDGSVLIQESVRLFQVGGRCV